MVIIANAKFVTYDLMGKDETSEDYQNLINAIKAYSNWSRVCLSAWIVITPNDCVTVRDNLRKYIDSNDRLFVAALTGEAAWTKVMCDPNWLTANLK